MCVSLVDIDLKGRMGCNYEKDRGRRTGMGLWLCDHEPILSQ